MKRILLVTAMLLAPLAAHAQSNAGAASQSAVIANQQTGSAAKTGDYTVNNYAGGTLTTKQDGTSKARVEAAPALGSISLGGGHPCAFAPFSAQASIIGGAAGVGGMKVDDVCMLFLLGSQGDAKARQAAVILMAGSDPKTCKAMEAAGMGVSCLTKAEKRAANQPVVSSRSAPKTSKVAFSVECKRNGNRITPHASRKVVDAYGMAAISNACR